MTTEILKIIGNDAKELDESLLPHDSVFGFFRSAVETAHNQLKAIHGQNLNTSTLFLDYMSVNAYSIVHKDLYCLCMNKGTVLKLKDFFYKIWTSSRVFRDIGKWEQITEFIVGEPIIIENGVRYQTHPLDPERQLYAERMATAAINFIILHEFGHLYNGHNGYLKEKRRLNFLNMFPTSNADINFERSLLELDADSTAIRLMIFLGYFDDTNNKMARRYGLDDSNAIYFFMCSISLLFRFLHNNYSEIGNVKGYLPIPFRLQTIYDEIMRMRKMLNPTAEGKIFFPEKSVEDCEDFVSQLEDDVTFIIQEVFEKGNMAFVDTWSDESFMELYFEVRNAWGSFSDNLDNHSIMPLTMDYSDTEG